MSGKLGFGCMRLPLRDAGDPSSVEMATLMRMTDIFIGRGFRYFDTAYTYCDGHSETALRHALVERYPREDYILADKLPTMLIENAGGQSRIFESQLRRCGVNFFDRYIVHCATADFYERARQLRSFEFVEERKREGSVRASGFSFHGSPELLDRILTEHPEVDFVQLQINYADWTRTPMRASECYDTARRHGKPVTVMGVLKGGLLADVPLGAERLMHSVCGNSDPAAWALRFAASLEGVDYVLSGMSSVEEMDRNTLTMINFKPFTRQEYAVADEIADAVCGGTPVQCTACGYCLPVCPERIAVPQSLHLYNAYSRMFGGRNYYDEYAALTEGRGRASDCRSCRECERVCPQGLRIADWMRRVADAFEYRRMPVQV
ncbi:MAG: aldo/keto reductase [Alistipes sp.]|nr:aldo/keto reductase [Alistipes sp.]